MSFQALAKTFYDVRNELLAEQREYDRQEKNSCCYKISSNLYSLGQAIYGMFFKNNFFNEYEREQTVATFFLRIQQISDININDINKISTEQRTALAEIIADLKNPERREELEVYMSKGNLDRLLQVCQQIAALAPPAEEAKEGKSSAHSVSFK